MKKLVNDGAPKVLGDKFDYIKIEDDKEFYAMLRQKLHDDIDRMYTEAGVEKKIQAYADIMNEMKSIQSQLERIDNFKMIVMDRDLTIGGVSKRYAAVPKGKGPKRDRSWVENWAKDNSYPRITIKQIDDTVLKAVGPGEESWKNALAWADMEEPYKSNFQELVAAIEDGPIKLEKERVPDGWDSALD